MAGFADASRIRQLCKQYPKRHGREAETIEIGISSCRTFGEWSRMTSLALVPWKSGETVRQTAGDASRKVWGEAVKGKGGRQTCRNIMRWSNLL